MVWRVQRHRSLAEPQELFQHERTPEDEGWSRAGGSGLGSGQPRVPGLSVRVLHEQLNPRHWEGQIQKSKNR